MNRRSKINYKIAGLGIAVCLGVFVGLSVWLYREPLTPAKIKIFNALPLPMVLVNGEPVAMSRFLLSYAEAKRLLGPEKLSQNDLEIKTAVYKKIINDEEYFQLAVKYGVSASQKEIDAEYALRAEQSDLEGKKNFSELLQSYGLNETAFKNQIIKPALLWKNLQIWHSSQESLNQATYAQAKNLADRINNGEAMAALAKAFSQDETGRAVSGDLGFVDISQILPELRETVSQMEVGEVKITPSRLGLHVIRL